MKILKIIPLVFILTACASASVIPLDKSTIQITARAAPACGGQGAEKVALNQAAVETLKRGYNKFIILNTSASNNVKVAGYTPVYSTTTANASIYGNNLYGTANTSYYGGNPIYAGSHNQGLIVKMFKKNSNAIDARKMLGPDWEKSLQKQTINCL
ncbi:hypothetical protein SAMN04488518_1256 [Pseudovibrio ascidiaceicola]|uniref:Lipoprotein n=2 Tax=Pseudovibrio ascidiaceicola TaxID=285279 RepID=A0A1I4G2E3_9HYPH|nr:hypothetical protein SAMN04488518_1256 [Pseudovibrio ascidiaceicola]